MLSITQSQNIHQLFAHLMVDMQQRQTSGQLGVFDQYHIIVPSASVKVWITQSLAQTQGISAMMQAKFWGSYQWQLMSQVLDVTPLSDADINDLPEVLKAGYQKNRKLVPKDPSLSIGFMQWRIFGFFQSSFEAFLTLTEKKQHEHPLYDFFVGYLPENKQHDSDDKKLAYWWQLAKQIAQVFSAYLTHRPEWLDGWSGKTLQHIDIKTLIAQKDALNKQNAQAITPDWLAEKYEKASVWQAHIWRALFVADYQYRQALVDLFWQKLHQGTYKTRLPKQITFFTLPPVPKSDLAFIRKLASYTDVLFLHYNPSQEYWADITDPYWLGKHSLTEPELARLRETGHFLLARMGKQARDTFKLLIELSGNVDDLFEQVYWLDDFIEREPSNLLQQIQQDILWLQEDGVIDWQVQTALDDLHASESQTSQPNQANSANQAKQPQTDNSLRIHACHNFTRQLEILREDIVVWLNASKADDRKRQLSDIVVMLPDLACYEANIRAVFPNHQGADGFYLPAKITGLVETEIDMLWQALSKRYTLLQNDFTSEQLFDWLMLPPVFESLELSHEQMQRACELLQEAGFKRGFDGLHLGQLLNINVTDSQNSNNQNRDNQNNSQDNDSEKQNINQGKIQTNYDNDSRFTLRYALDRLTLGLVMPQASFFQSHDQTNVKESLPLSSVALEDAPIISALLQVFDDLNHCRTFFSQPLIKRQPKNQFKTLIEWLSIITEDLENHFSQYRGQQSWLEVTDAIKQLKNAYLAYQAEAIKQQSDKDPEKEHPEKSEKEKTKTVTLNFVLDTLNETIASSMRGSEPTGAITFCRMGTLRPIPYKLVVVMNMNIGDYPKREQPNHFNLMSAGLSQVGDRQREDDETGAFLDALIMAEEACWFFYNGFSTSDTHTHLPANPLQELLMFLENIVAKTKREQANLLETEYEEKELLENKQTSTNGADKATSQMRIPQLIAHPPLPFSKASFIPELAESTQKSQALVAQRHQGFWYDIYKTLYVAEKQAPHRFIDWSANISFPKIDTDQAKTDFIDGKRFINDLAKPAQHFLRCLQVANIEGEDKLATLEPLNLDNLSEYNIREALLDDFSVDGKNQQNIRQKLHFDALLPAGVVKDAYYAKATSFLKAQLDTLKIHAPQGKTQTHDQTVTLTMGQHTHHITYPLPTQSTALWADVLPTNGANHHKLKLWLTHLLWQMARQTSATQVNNLDGRTLCVYKADIICFNPVLATMAQQYLIDWLTIWQYNQQMPMVLPPKYGLIYAERTKEQKTDLLTNSQINSWLKGSMGLGYTADDCSQHPTWQLILAGQDALSLLITHLDVFMERLYLPIVEHEHKVYE